MTRTARVLSEGSPTQARLVLVGESPAAQEVLQGRPFVGRAGKRLDAGLAQAGIARGDCYICNVVPTRAPGDKFSRHAPDDLAWGLGLLEHELRACRRDALVVPLGDNPLRHLTGFRPQTHLPQYPDGKKESLIGAWRGSLLQPGEAPYAQDSLARRLGLTLLPTFHPAAVERRFEWCAWLYLDFQRAARWLRGAWQPPRKRKWHVGPGAALALLHAKPEVVAFDSESDPEPIVAFATADAVYVWAWTGSTDEQGAMLLLTSSRVLKLAHNFLHDWPWVRRRCGVTPCQPWWDTMGAAHVAEAELQKELSPHVSTRWTTHAYHKYLYNTDALRYCGMDAVVCFDAWEGQVESLRRAKLDGVAQHDLDLAAPLLDMQYFGVAVDEAQRAEAEMRLTTEVASLDDEVRQAVEPVVRARWQRFRKPHLFRRDARCACCGGGRQLREHCWRCAGLGDARPLKPALVVHWQERGVPDAAKRKVAELLALLPPCDACDGSGKAERFLPVNTDSSDQLADLLYRGLGLPARRFQGRETVRAKQLVALRDRHPLVERLIVLSEARAGLDTVRRLAPDYDGRLHCVFNPWGTRHGRVASYEGFVYVGTNLQNLPESARNIIVPDEGCVFLYPDMSQIEARVVAVLSKDRELLRIFSDPTLDSHDEIARLVSEVVGPEVLEQAAKFESPPTPRQAAKRIAHASNYGEGAANLAQRLHCLPAQAEAVQRAYLRRFPGVPAWHQRVADELTRTRGVLSLTGRRIRYLGRMFDRRGQLTREVLKRGLSFAPQDCAAWLLADGLLALWRSGEWGKLVRGVVHCHDALLVQAPTARLTEAKALCAAALTQERWGMLFPVEIKVGHNWRDVARA